MVVYILILHIYEVWLMQHKNTDCKRFLFTLSLMVVMWIQNLVSITFRIYKIT